MDYACFFFKDINLYFIANIKQTEGGIQKEMRMQDIYKKSKKAIMRQ